MTGVNVLRGIGVPLDRSEIDTDALYPAEFEAVALRDGYGAALLGRWRLDEPGFLLNHPPFADGTVLFAGPDFGIGSSREQAVWALTGWGFHAIFSSRFGDIFQANCARNDVVAGVLPNERVKEFIDHLLAHPGGVVDVNIEQQTVATQDGSLTGVFTMEEFARRKILSGESELDSILGRAARIEQYEEHVPVWLPSFR